MQNKKLFTLMLIALSIISCKQQNSAEASIDQGTEAAPKKNVDSESNKMPESDLSDTVLPNTPAPDAKTVLADIYKQKVKEVTGEQLSDGRYVGYWNGQQFVRNRKNYFVAFTEATPPSEIEYPTPEDKVTISQATYELAGNQWQLKNVQQDVGEFGGNNKAPAVDTAQKTAVFQDVQGKLVLATPSVIFANMGIQLFSNEIFVFSPENEKWKYLGSVKTGSDNTAGCAHEADSATKAQCATSSGTLQFSPIKSSSWPELKVVLKGTQLGNDGKLITLSDKDTVTYRYDEKLSTYQMVR